jgi:hypothetical protein
VVKFGFSKRCVPFFLPHRHFAFSVCSFFNCNLCFQIPKGRDVEDKDEFVFNEDFSAPLYRIKVMYVHIHFGFDMVIKLELLFCASR